MIKKICLCLFFVNFCLSIFPDEPALTPSPAVSTEPSTTPSAAPSATASQESALSQKTEKITQTFEDLLSAKKITLSFYKINFFIRLGFAAAILIVQIIFIRLTFHIALAIKKKMLHWGFVHFKPIKIKKFVLLDTKQQRRLIAVLVNIIRWIVIIIQLIVTVPMIFSCFEPTRNLAKILFGYILTPLKNIAISFIKYIPNLFAVAIIIIIARYALRGLRFFKVQIEKKKLVIPGFYPDWAEPTYNILRVLIIAFSIAVIYPHLPNSDSEAFKGISVLVGILFSLGSSSVIGNLIAGLVMTYMRPFQKGDRIKINDVTGFIVERSAMVTRVRTDKNEYVSFPNSMILNTSVTNYNSSTAPGLDGLMVHVDITMGYDVPWTQVHEILLDAAVKTKSIRAIPKPFVRQNKLDDFYCWYELNAYTKDVHLLPTIYSDLNKNIQNGFREKNISMFAPHYTAYKITD